MRDAMRRLCLALCAGAIWLGALTGCGDKTAGNGEPGAKPEEKGESGGPVQTAPVEEPRADPLVPAEAGVSANVEDLRTILRENLKPLETAQKAVEAEKKAVEAARLAMEAEKKAVEAGRKAADHEQKARDLEEKLQGCEQAAAAGRSGLDRAFETRLRGLCESLAAPAAGDGRQSPGWEGWRDKLKLRVRDYRVWVPLFKDWSLLKVDSDTRYDRRGHKTGRYGFGMTVDVENASTEILHHDGVLAWVTFTTDAGPRVCLAESSSSRTWAPFRNKSKGEWIAQKGLSERPFRPGEKKRYVLHRNDCLDALVVEQGVKEIGADVYFRFATREGGFVTAGPLASMVREGTVLQGAPLAGAPVTVARKTRKGTTSALAWYLAGDRFMVRTRKGTDWLPVDELPGVDPLALPPLARLPQAPASLDAKYGSLSLRVEEWTLTNWEDLKGAVGQGHKLLTATVTIAIDSSRIKEELEAAVTRAGDRLLEMQADIAVKESALEAARAGLDSGDEASRKAAKAAVEAAASQLKASRQGLAAAKKNLKAVEKTSRGGVDAFLKTQVANLDCGSFALDVGRRVLKPEKGSINKKACASLSSDGKVTGKVAFELRRFDVPFALTWKGPRSEIEVYPVASHRTARIFDR